MAQKDGDEFVYLIDPDSMLEVKITETRKLRGAVQVSESELGDYEAVGGVMQSSGTTVSKVNETLDKVAAMQARAASGAAADTARALPQPGAADVHALPQLSLPLPAPPSAASHATARS